MQLVRVTWCFSEHMRVPFSGITDYIEFYFVSLRFSWLFLSRFFQLHDHEDANWILANIYSDKNDQFDLKDIYFFINRNDRILRIINIIQGLSPQS